MSTAAAGLIVEDDDARATLEVVATVGPEVGACGAPLAGIERLHRGFIRMQDLPLQEQAAQSLDQRLQTHSNLTDPVRQGGTGNRHTVAGADLLETIEREMIEVLLRQHPGMQAGRGQACLDDRRRDRCSGHGFTVAAGVLRTDVAMDEEACRLDIEWLADVLADLDQVATAVPAGAGRRFVTVLDARQLRRSRFASRAFVGAHPRCWGLLRRQASSAAIAAASSSQVSRNRSRCTGASASRFTPKRMRL